MGFRNYFRQIILPSFKGFSKFVAKEFNYKTGRGGQVV